MSVLANLKDLAARGKFAARANSPKLLLIGGIALGVACVATTVRATLKAAPVIDEAKIELDNIEFAESEEGKAFEEAKRAAREEEGIDEEDAELLKPKTRKQVIRGTAWKMAKLYALPTGLGLASVGCTLAGFKILDGRYLAATVGYEGIAATFDRYRKAVRDKYGDDVDKALYYGEGSKEDEDGRVINIEKQDDPNTWKDVPMYGPYCVRYTNTSYHPGLDVQQLMHDKDYWQTQLDSVGYVLLNDILKAMHMEIKGEYEGVGWISRKWKERLFPDGGYLGDGYIDFGVFDGKGGAQAAAWREGKAREVILDFNVDGSIYKYIDAINALRHGTDMDILAYRMDNDSITRMKGR